MKTTRIAYYSAAALVVLLVSALLGWYLFLAREETSIAAEDSARGRGSSPQTFTGEVGSTYKNVLSSFARVDPKDETPGKTRRLTKVGQNPVSGIGFVVSGTSTRLRSVERSSGNVLEAGPDGKLERLTNTLVPDVFETIIMKTGRVIMRSIDKDGTVLTSIGTVASSSADAVPLTRRSLPNNIRSIVGSPDGEEIFYIIGSDGAALGIRAKWDGTSPKQLFASAISGWQLQWTLSDRIVLVQNATDGLSGYAYAIEKSGEMKTLLGNVPGLTVLAQPTSPAILYGSSDGGLSLYARTDDGATPVLLPVKTIAEKCVWATDTELMAYCAVPDGIDTSNFLNRWYRGEVHTRDAWWRINVSAGTAELLYSSGAEPFDAVRPAIDPSGNYIVFTNAIDQSGRTLRIEE